MVLVSVIIFITAGWVISPGSCVHKLSAVVVDPFPTMLSMFIRLDLPGVTSEVAIGVHKPPDCKNILSEGAKISRF